MCGYYGTKTSRLIPKLLGLVPNFAARLCCKTTQRQFKFCGLSIVGSRRILNNTNVNVCMEHNSKLRFTCLTHDAEVQTIEEDSAVSSTPVKGSEETGPKKSKKRRLKPRAKCRKQNLKTVDCSANLLAELPFVNTETWKDLGFTTSEKIHKKKRKRGESGQRESGEDDVKKKKKQSRPNYFVSIAITSPEVKAGIKTVQDLIVQKDHRLARALIPVGTLHITLLVTHLGSEEEVSTAVCALAQMKQALQDLLRGRGLVLPFTGIGHFKNEVVFVQLAEGEHTGTLTAIAEAVQKAFQERGIASGDCKAFQPHLTFMKLSKAPKLRKQGIRKLDPSLYAEFAEHRFGSEMVSRVDLCSMLKKKTSGGYYHCETSVALGQKRGEEPDDEELVSLSKRLVEDAVLKAVQQYMEETQQGVGGAAAEGPPPAPAGDGVNASTSE